jgi:hypothetical protein
MTGEDDFNALASAILDGNAGASVYRLAPPARSHGVVAPYTGAEILFDAGLTRSATRSERQRAAFGGLGLGLVRQAADQDDDHHRDRRADQVAEDIHPPAREVATHDVRP